MQAEFTDEFQHFLSRLPKRQYPTQADWIEHEVKPMGVFDETRMYKPLVLPVRCTARRGNYVGVRVTPWRKGWWDVTQKGIAAMMGIRDARKVDLRDIYGNTLKTMDVNAMAGLDEVEVYDGQDQVLVTNQPMPHMSISPLKDDMLETWWERTADEMTNIAAEVLKGTETVQELGSKLAIEDPARGTDSGKLERALRKMLAQEINAQFVNDFSENDDVAAMDPDMIINDIARLAMAGIRHSIKNSRPDVDKCLSNYAHPDDIFQSSEVGNRYANKTNVDEFRTYRKIGDYGMHYGNLGRNVLVVIRHGNPHRHHKRKMCRAHHGDHHHHETAHNTVVHQWQQARPVTWMPYKHPTRDMPTWWYGALPYEFYTSGAGAHHHERKQLVMVYRKSDSPQMMTDESDPKPAELKDPKFVRSGKAKAMGEEYRGNYQRAVNQYHLFSGRAPVPTPTLVKQIVRAKEASGSADLVKTDATGFMDAEERNSVYRDLLSETGAAEEVGANWFQKRRAKYRRKRLENARKKLEKAQADGKEKRIAYWEKRVQYWEGKTAQDDGIDMDEMIAQAIAEDMFDNQEPIEAIAEATWLIGCHACKQRDRAYYERKLRKYEDKLQKAKMEEDDEDIRDYEAKIVKYRSALGFTSEYRLVGEDMDSPYHRFLSIEEALMHHAADFYDDEPQLVQAEETIGERIVDTMTRYLYKYANEETPIEALLLARELHEEAPNELARGLWGRVLNIAEDEIGRSSRISLDPNLMQELMAIFSEDDDSTKQAREQLEAHAQDGDDEALIRSVTEYVDDAGFSDKQKDAMLDWLRKARRAQTSETKQRARRIRRYRRKVRRAGRDTKKLTRAERSLRRQLRKQQRSSRRLRRLSQSESKTRASLDKYGGNTPVVIDPVSVSDEMPIGAPRVAYQDTRAVARSDAAQRVVDYQEQLREVREQRLFGPRVEERRAEERLEKAKAAAARQKFYDERRGRLPPINPSSLEDEIVFAESQGRQARNDGNERAAELYEKQLAESYQRAARPVTTPQIGKKAPAFVKDSIPEFQPEGMDRSVRVGDRVIRLVDRRANVSPEKPNAVRVEETAQGLLKEERLGGKPARSVAERRMKAARETGDVGSADFYQAVLNQMPVQAPVPTPSFVSDKKAAVAAPRKKVILRERSAPAVVQERLEEPPAINRTAPRTTRVRVSEPELNTGAPMTFAEMMKLKKANKNKF
jgi:hypothetical protein